MKNLKFLFILVIACILILPFGVFAEGEEEETTATEENKEVTVYFFRGEGCPHCEEFESWLQEIEPEYGSLFEVKDYETWNNKENNELMKKVAEARGEEANGVPYIIIGNKSWNGFAEEYVPEILDEIQKQYETKPEERYDIMKYVDLTPKKEGFTAKDFISSAIIIVIAFLIVLGIVQARKNTK